MFASGQLKTVGGEGAALGFEVRKVRVSEDTEYSIPWLFKMGEFWRAVGHVYWMHCDFSGKQLVRQGGYLEILVQWKLSIGRSCRSSKSAGLWSFPAQDRGVVLIIHLKNELNSKENTSSLSVFQTQCQTAQI